MRSVVVAPLEPRAVAKCLHCSMSASDGRMLTRHGVKAWARSHAQRNGHRIQLERIETTVYVGRKP